MPQMDCSQVLRKLSEIENAVGVLDSLTIRKMLIEMQDFILQSQKESLQNVRNMVEQQSAMRRKPN